MLPGIDGAEPGSADHALLLIDAEGNRVAGTQSINFFFGSGLMVPGTGVMLNNEMDDFAAKPGVPNGFRLVGADANAIAPGKRPLSSMTPTFIEKPDGVMILGTPGGSVHHEHGAARRRSTGWTACRPTSSSRRAAITTSTCPTRSRSSPARSPKKKSRRCRSTATRCASRAARQHADRDVGLPQRRSEGRVRSARRRCRRGVLSRLAAHFWHFGQKYVERCPCTKCLIGVRHTRHGSRVRS